MAVTSVSHYLVILHHRPRAAADAFLNLNVSRNAGKMGREQPRLPPSTP